MCFGRCCQKWAGEAEIMRWSSIGERDAESITEYDKKDAGAQEWLGWRSLPGKEMASSTVPRRGGS